jgi:hypothetical protein
LFFHLQKGLTPNWEWKLDHLCASLHKKLPTLTQTQKINTHLQRLVAFHFETPTNQLWNLHFIKRVPVKVTFSVKGM